MITPKTVNNNLITTDTTGTNLLINRIDQDAKLTISSEVFLEYNMNEYGETPTETSTISNYDLDTEATITAVSTTGLTITYTADKTFQAGDTITIMGITPSQFNFKDVVVASSTATTFTINSTETGTYVAGGKASLRADYYPVQNIIGLPFKKLFPIDTIKKSSRPNNSGIKYAILGDLDPGENYTTYSNPKTFEYGNSMISKHRVYYPGEDTYYKYWVGKRGGGIDLRINYPKTILTNKIVIKFETSHSVPATWSVYLSNSTTPIISGTSADIPIMEGPNKGVLELYYNGSTWTKDFVWSCSSTVSTTDIRITATKETGSTDKFIGVIEVCPIWKKQIYEEVVGFSIVKDSSSGTEEYLPVGRISANALAMSLFIPGALTAQQPEDQYFQAYDKNMTISSSKLYLSKNLVIKPYLILREIDNESGAYINQSPIQVIAKQGTFYIDSWDVNEFGEISISARDSAKILQETIAAPILCKNYTTTGIIRYLLDSIGFTNYKFNYRRVYPGTGAITSDYGDVKDESGITPHYWWTDSDKSVWDALSELCRDTQLTAFFDEENVLQIFTKDALFDANRKVQPSDTSPVIWKFRNTIESNTPKSITGASYTYLPNPINQFEITYTTDVAHQLSQGDVVTISGINPATLNREDIVVTSAPTTTTFKVKVLFMYAPFSYVSGGTVIKKPSLPNIISFNKSEEKSTNKIKVLYYAAYGSELDLNQSKQPLWSSQNTRYIGAGVLRKNLPSVQTNGFIELDPVRSTTKIEESVISYTGYLAIGPEIIEFDGTEYQYIHLETGIETAIIKSKSELEQIISVAKAGVGDQNIKPTGRYQIKTRGAFGTPVIDHIIDTSQIINSWNTLAVSWK